MIVDDGTWLEKWLARRLQDPEFKRAYDELEPAFQVARLRLKRGLTQKELAKRIGTKQSSIARLESGRFQPSLSFLRRVIDALDGVIEVRIAAREKTAEEKARVEEQTSTQVTANTASMPAAVVWLGYARSYRVVSVPPGGVPLFDDAMERKLARVA